MSSQPPMLAADLAQIAERSRALILSLQDVSGAYPASPSFSAYQGYSWLRDGAFIADAMSAAGESASASAFFGWCARTLVERAPDIHRIVAAARSGSPVADGEMLPTRFTLDGGTGDDDWWDFQLDGYGLWLWAALVHAERHSLDVASWRRAMELTIDYLVASWDRPCYDWWEEHVEEVHVSTLGSIEAGLRAAARCGVLDTDRRRAAAQTADAVARLTRERGTVDGHLVKWIGSTSVDASLAALIAPLQVIPGDSDLGRATLAELERQLVVDGGAHRFTTDTYYGGGQWPLLSCFIGLAQLDAGHAVRARELLEWAAGTEREGGTIPEQVDDHLIDAAFVDEWVQRWGPSADPLLWSHAMFLRLAVELGVVTR
jgi:GH15 family glucan-1,4-alpha-glucosidase